MTMALHGDHFRRVRGWDFPAWPRGQAGAPRDEPMQDGQVRAAQNRKLTWALKMSTDAS